jgi:hypothetical protein
VPGLYVRLNGHVRRDASASNGRRKPTQALIQRRIIEAQRHRSARQLRKEHTVLEQPVECPQFAVNFSIFFLTDASDRYMSIYRRRNRSTLLSTVLVHLGPSLAGETAQGEGTDGTKEGRGSGNFAGASCRGNGRSFIHFTYSSRTLCRVYPVARAPSARQIRRLSERRWCHYALTSSVA